MKTNGRSVITSATSRIMSFGYSIPFGVMQA